MSSLLSATDPTVTVLRAGSRESVQVPDVRVCLAKPGGAVATARLTLAPVVVGTHAECELAAEDPAISRMHCSLQLTSHGLLLKDLGSKNGTFVGKVRVREVLLPIGVRATLGSSELWAEASGTATEVPLSPVARFGDALGGSVPMRALFAQLERYAKGNDPVTLEGESGTGKELLARAIHDASDRRGKPFVVVECASLSPQLIEAELFGSEAGAFTGATQDRMGLFEQADGGTLFLDEIGELPLELQPPFVRALEAKEIRRVGASTSKQIDVRLISASQRDIRAKLLAGEFRQDLYYRLAVLEARVPPLRERLDDLALLVEEFLGQMDPPQTLAILPAGALELLRSHRWPGNVRELRNAVIRLVLHPETGDVLLQGMKQHGPRWSGLPLTEARAALVDAFERQYVAAALAAHDGNVTSTAKALGVSRQIIHRLLLRHRSRNDDAG